MQATDPPLLHAKLALLFHYFKFRLKLLDVTWPVFDVCFVAGL